MAIMILRYFNVIGSDPDGRLGEAPRPELREHGRISGACFDAARGIIAGLKVTGTDYKTHDGTCIRDYIDVTDLVDAHVKALEKAMPGKVGIYNVGTGMGRSVKEFVQACKKATGVDIKVDYLPRRPGDYAEVFSDPSKINRELNWTAKYTDLQKSLKVAWRWQKSHQKGYESPFVDGFLNIQGRARSRKFNSDRRPLAALTSAVFLFSLRRGVSDKDNFFTYQFITCTRTDYISII
ncbi:hypothetical protein OIU85_002838 [Salix viminalis]|uniref:NAD(P)-binding domain-containing protein n=1 Tax=Salix viminalis TaxID=40686 RepID=A0A9Q0ZZA7_SALVM|nr:hypothetical protein OIU85_002838 [Salix viminalis]